LYVHSAPSALCPHVEWAVGGILAMPVSLSWTGQAALHGTYRAELSWAGAVGTAARLTSALRGWEQLCFEVTEEATASSEGERFSYVPELGVFSAVIGLTGDVMVSENRLKAAIIRSSMAGTELSAEVDRLLGKPWDDELEVFRYAGDGAPVRWLHQVV
jgi:hypothetical protein